MTLRSSACRILAWLDRVLKSVGGIAWCPPPRRRAAAQPSMIEDRGVRSARVPERDINGENGVVCSEGTASLPLRSYLLHFFETTRIP